METPAQAQSASDRYPQVASPIHTILVLAALGSWAIWHKSFAQLNLTANPNRVRFYIVTVFYEWLLFVLVVAGVGGGLGEGRGGGEGRDWGGAGSLKKKKKKILDEIDVVKKMKNALGIQ